MKILEEPVSRALTEQKELFLQHLLIKGEPVFFDIETTGLSWRNSHVYLIGVIFRKNGIFVRLTAQDTEHFAVIDHKLVWHGGMNLLGKADAWDNLIRVENAQAAAELLEMADFQTKDD